MRPLKLIVIGLLMLTAACSWPHQFDMHPEAAERHYQRGLAFYNKKEYHRALDEYLQATNVRHNYPEAWLGTGLCYVRIQNPVGAEDAFKQVLSYLPEYPEAIYNLGILYFEQKKDDLAITHLKRAIEASDAYPRAYYAFGVVHERGNQEEEAEAAYRKALALNPDLSEALWEKNCNSSISQFWNSY